jgi:hypothetical protein
VSDHCVMTHATSVWMDINLTMEAFINMASGIFQ